MKSKYVINVMMSEEGTCYADYLLNRACSGSLICENGQRSAIPPLPSTKAIALRRLRNGLLEI